MANRRNGSSGEGSDGDGGTVKTMSIFPMPGVNMLNCSANKRKHNITRIVHICDAHHTVSGMGFSFNFLFYVINIPHTFAEHTYIRIRDCGNIPNQSQRSNSCQPAGRQPCSSASIKTRCRMSADGVVMATGETYRENIQARHRRVHAASAGKCGAMTIPVQMNIHTHPCIRVYAYVRAPYAEHMMQFHYRIAWRTCLL